MSASICCQKTNRWTVFWIGLYVCYASPGPIFGPVFVSLAPAGLAPTYIWIGFESISHRSICPRLIFGPMLAEFRSAGPVVWTGFGSISHSPPIPVQDGSPELSDFYTLSEPATIEHTSYLFPASHRSTMKGGASNSLGWVVRQHKYLYKSQHFDRMALRLWNLYHIHIYIYI